jgi:hypothetical protein
VGVSPTVQTLLPVPTVTGLEMFSSCSLVLDPDLSPYREAFDLSELP